MLVVDMATTMLCIWDTHILKQLPIDRWRQRSIPCTTQHNINISWTVPYMFMCLTATLRSSWVSSVCWRTRSRYFFIWHWVNADKNSESKDKRDGIQILDLQHSSHKQIYLSTLRINLNTIKVCNSLFPCPSNAEGQPEKRSHPLPVLST